MILPQQFSTANGSLQGAVDGFNPIFTLSVPVQAAQVFLNGLLQTNGVDCVAVGQAVQFLQQAPQPGDLVTVSGFPIQ